jgi:LysM repeat protein
MTQTPFTRTEARLGAIALTALLLSILLLGTPVHAQGGSYTVQPGDTLSEIAARYGTDAATLARLNGLSSARLIRVGQTLIVSGSGAASSSAATGSGSYTVQPGDTLLEIAARYGISLETLRALNNMTPYSRLYAGTTLVVSGTPSASVSNASTSSSASSSGGGTHTVQRGEYLSAIAARYGTTVQAIVNVNNLPNARAIYPGQVLEIPEGMTVEVSSTGRGYSGSSVPTGGKWIDVDLSAQRVTAYEGSAPVRYFIISSGLPGTPTVTGTFRIWSKTPIQNMSGGSRVSGDAYYLQNVPWVQYFYENYSFHGTYWHNLFGQPMSRGCINMRTNDAKWLYDWAGPAQVRSSGLSYASPGNPGTLVVVHD